MIIININLTEHHSMKNRIYETECKQRYWSTKLQGRFLSGES